MHRNAGSSYSGNPPPPWWQRVSAWWRRNRRAVHRRFVLGVAYGAGSGVGGFVIAYLIWLIQS